MGDTPFAVVQGTGKQHRPERFAVLPILEDLDRIIAPLVDGGFVLPNCISVGLLAVHEMRVLPEQCASRRPAREPVGMGPRKSMEARLEAERIEWPLGATADRRPVRNSNRPRMAAVCPLIVGRQGAYPDAAGRVRRFAC